MQIVLYKDLSDAKTIINVDSGKAVKDVIPFDDWSRYAVIVNGTLKTPDYIIKDTDLIAIRAVPFGLFGWSWSTWSAIGWGVLGLMTGGIATIIHYGVESYNQAKEAQEALKEIERLKNATKDETVNIAYLKGASNSVATGKTQPYIIGTYLFTPYILNAGGTASKGYSTISGDTGESQFYNLVLECGFNKQVLQRIYCDDIQLKNFADTEPQEGIYEFESNSVFASADSFCEVAQDGAEFETDYFNQKVVEQQVSDSLEVSDSENYEPLYYTLEQNAMAANLCIMFTNGLCHYDTEGIKGTRTRNIFPYYSLDYATLVANGDSDPENNATWKPFYFQKVTYTTKRTDTTVYGTYTYSFPMFTNNKKNISDSEIKTYCLKLKQSWTLTSSTDIRAYITDVTISSTQKVTSSYKEGKRTKYSHRVTCTISARGIQTSTEEVKSEVNTTQFSYKTSKQMRFNAHVDFSYDDVKALEYPITLRLSTTDSKSSTGSDYDAVQVQWVQSECYDEDASEEASAFVAQKVIETREAKLSTILGMHIESTTANEDKLSSIQIVTSGIARTWDSDTEEWSTDKTVTSNPAAWLLEVLTSSAHTPSQVDDDEIDLDAFGELYEYCEENDIEVNYVITQGKTKSSVLELLCTVCHAALYQSIYGKITVAWDDYKENAIAVLNEQNLISFEWTKDIKRQPDGVKLTYTDAENDYNEASIICMYNQYDSDGNYDPFGNNRSADCTLTALSCDGITSQNQAYLYALYTMKCDRLRPLKATAVVGQEGVYYTPLSKVLVQHPSFKNGLGNAEIKSVITDVSGNIVGLELYDALDLDTTNSFNVIINCVSDSYSTPKSYAINGYDGRTKEIEFTTAIDASETVIPHSGDILSYGYEVDTITNPMLITGISPSDNGYSLTLVDYNEEIYDTDFDIPEYTPNITQPRKAQIKDNTESGATVDDVMGVKEDLSKVISGTASVGSPSTPVITAKATKDGIELSCAAFSAGLANSIMSITWEILKKGATEYETFTSGSLTYTYSFDRDDEGYPEASDLAEWSVRAKATNKYSLTSEYGETTVDTSDYGTWELQAPTVSVRISDRTATLVLSQPARSDNKDVYGTIKHRVYIRKPSVDEEDTFYKPATGLDPYASEDNYKNGDGYVEAESVYIQTLPLTGQDTSEAQDTLYQFKVVAFSEADTSDPTVANATVTCTSIRDIVIANEDYKELYVGALSAISANLGVIKQGSLSGNDNNYWALSTVTDDDGNTRYQGAMRVGGDDEYLEVIPTVVNGTITGYTISFKVGNFEVTSEASSINGELIIQEESTSLNRIRVNPLGVFFENRTSSTSTEWEVIGRQSLAGTQTPQIFTDNSLVITNKTMAERRISGSDIGLSLPTNALVYHFDTDLYDQKGNNTLTISHDSGDVYPVLKGQDDDPSEVTDFVPAVRAVAPFSTVAKMLYGNYTATKTISASNTFAIDFWLKYIWNESQTLFKVGNDDQYVSVQLIDSEPYYNVPLTDEPDYNDATSQSESLVYNEILENQKYIKYHSTSGDTQTTIDTSLFNEGEWVHVGLICNGTNIFVIINTTIYTLEQAAQFADDMTISLNPSEGLFCLDEFMISTEEVITTDSFIANTTAAIPYGALDYTKKHFVLDVGDNFWTNLFSTDAFKSAVQDIIDNQ